MLEDFFHPSSVAIVGVSADAHKIGSLIFHNMIEAGFEGELYQVNPKYESLFGYPCYPTLSAIPGSVSLAVLVTPASLLPQIMTEAGQKGVKAVIVISSGFKERGIEGGLLEEKLTALAHEYGMRMMGPNCLGVIVPGNKLNASFAASFAPSGNIAFLSQSGAYCAALLDIASSTQLGFSHFVSLGNKADLGELELIQAFLQEDQVKVIGAYLESITFGRAFIQTIMEARKKPLVILKGGETARARRAVLSHTGVLAGSTRTYKSAFKKAGIIEADSLRSLTHLVRAFSWSHLPQGGRVAILTNAGGPAIVTVDQLIHHGLEVAILSPETGARLQALLPPAAALENPVDLLGDATADRFRLALDLLGVDKRVDAILVMVTPQVVTQIEETTKQIVQAMHTYSKPIFPIFLGENYVASAISYFYAHKCVVFKEIEDAVTTLAALVAFATAAPLHHEVSVASYYQKGRHRQELLAFLASDKGKGVPDLLVMKLLEEVGISLPKQKLCTNVEAAVAYAKTIFPVVVKAPNAAIAHKSERGAVVLQVRDEQAVRHAYAQIADAMQEPMPTVWVQEQVEAEAALLVGAHRDGSSQVYEPKEPGFGHLLVFGQGGIYTEIYHDVGYALVPASRVEIEQALKQTAVYAILRGARGKKPLAVDKYLDTICAIQKLVLLYPEIVSLDINPLLATPTRIVAVDAKIFCVH